MEIYKEFSFDSAHFLTKVSEEHKCRHIHGHTYKLKVYIKGQINEQGWIIDFKELKNSILQIIDLVDHKLLNDIPGLENPTAETLTIWFWQRIKSILPMLSRIELHETATTGVVYSGE